MTSLSSASLPLRGAAAAGDPATDEAVVNDILAGDQMRFEILMRRHNTRLFRTARSILRDDAEAEDAVQQAYLSAYEHLGDFDGRAQFSTWLTRIAVHESLRRRDRQGRLRPLEAVPEPSQEPMADPDPERRTATRQLRKVLEKLVDGLPESYRVVFMLRDVQELSTRETAEVLDVSEEAVRVRLHRARQAIRDAMDTRTSTAIGELFGFAGERCERIVRAVFAALESV